MKTFTAGALMLAALATTGCVANLIPTGPTPNTSAPVVGFDPPDGTYSMPATVGLVCNNPGASIYYTLDSVTPNPTYLLYTAPLVLSNTSIVKAYASKIGWEDSATTFARYVLTTTSQAAAPVFSLTNGSYNLFRSVFITCATPGATIYYTQDGSTPTVLSATYQPIAVSTSRTIKAIAYATNWAASVVVTATYTIF
ncbi:MAG: chitobiase/beta-hexosaminidase C-terminal domain-containing protein [Spirochaetes bacterium]|nr:chitobiase/beta-hexosaminidase C-terminal domain-containing protein [Spirochaetota bacterium]